MFVGGGACSKERQWSRKLVNILHRCGSGQPLVRTRKPVYNLLTDEVRNEKKNILPGLRIRRRGTAFFGGFPRRAVAGSRHVAIL